MRIYASQNAPFTIMYDSWKNHSRELVSMTPEESRTKAEVILGKVLSNRKPPYSISGGLFDVLEKSGGDMFKVTNDEIVSWVVRYYSAEGYDIFPASACAVASLKQALDNGTVKKDETIMLNVTGGGMLNATRKGFMLKEPDLVLSPELPAEEIIAAIDKLF